MRRFPAPALSQRLKEIPMLSQIENDSGATCYWSFGSPESTLKAPTTLATCGCRSTQWQKALRQCMGWEVMGSRLWLHALHGKSRGSCRPAGRLIVTSWDSLCSCAGIALIILSWDSLCSCAGIALHLKSWDSLCSCAGIALIILSWDSLCSCAGIALHLKSWDSLCSCAGIALIILSWDSLCSCAGIALHLKSWDSLCSCAGIALIILSWDSLCSCAGIALHLKSWDSLCSCAGIALIILSWDSLCSCAGIALHLTMIPRFERSGNSAFQLSCVGSQWTGAGVGLIDEGKKVFVVFLIDIALALILV